MGFTGEVLVWQIFDTMRLNLYLHDLECKNRAIFEDEKTYVNDVVRCIKITVLRCVTCPANMMLSDQHNLGAP